VPPGLSIGQPIGKSVITSIIKRNKKEYLVGAVAKRTF
jgi:hypothetical protein